MSPVGTLSQSANGSGDEKKEKVPAPKRDYQVGTRVKGTVDQLCTAIEEAYAEGQEGEVYIVHGRSKAANPTLAITGYGQVHDLDGDYELAADRSFTKLPNVKTGEGRRKVSIG